MAEISQAPQGPNSADIARQAELGRQAASASGNATSNMDEHTSSIPEWLAGWLSLIGINAGSFQQNILEHLGRKEGILDKQMNQGAASLSSRGGKSAELGGTVFAKNMNWDKIVHPVIECGAAASMASVSEGNLSYITPSSTPICIGNQEHALG